MTTLRIGQVLFAIGLAALGLMSLIFDDFALVWQPVPDGLPLRACFAYASGAVLLITGIGMLVPRTAARSALVLVIFVTSWLLVLQLPRVVREPGNVLMWLGFGENLLLVAGGWVLVRFLALRTSAERTALAQDHLTRMARLLFAASLPIIGLSHFVYVDGTAAMVPAWLPYRVAIAYLTGAGHVAAGIGILLGIVPRLAATLEAVMLTLFVVLLHAPGVMAAPRDRFQWTMLGIATAYTGAAWAVAGSLHDIPWARIFRARPRGPEVAPMCG